MLLGLDLDLLAVQPLDQVVVVGRHVDEEVAGAVLLRAQLAREPLAPDGDFFDLAAVELAQELAEGELGLRPGALLEEVDQQDHHHEDDGPQQEGLESRAQRCSSEGPGTSEGPEWNGSPAGGG